MSESKISIVVAHGFGRRDFLRSGLSAGMAGAAALSLPSSAFGEAKQPPGERPSRQAFELAAEPALAGLTTLAAQDAQNGGAVPFPIPWLDKNGSLNQAPGLGQEPSSIFHFKGRIARANGFTGWGTDNRGRRIPFGTATTDFSIMEGAYWAGREERHGAFAHT